MTRARLDAGVVSGPAANGADDATAWAGLLAELEIALEAAGMPVRDAWIVGTQFWRNAYCSDPECCARPAGRSRRSGTADSTPRWSSAAAASAPPPVRKGEATPPPVDPAIRAAESGWAAQFSPRRRDRAQFAQVLDVWTMVMNQAAPNPGAGNSCVADSEASEAKTLETGNPMPGTPMPGPWAGRLNCQRNWLATCGPACASRHGGTPCWSWRQPVGRRLNVAQTTLACSTSRAPGLPPDRVFAPARSDARSHAESAAHPGVRCARYKSALTKSPPQEPANSGTRQRPMRPASGGTPGADAVPGYGEVLLGLAPAVPDWALMDGLERVLELLGRLGDGEPTAAAVTAGAGSNGAAAAVPTPMPCTGRPCGSARVTGWPNCWQNSADAEPCAAGRPGGRRLGRSSRPTRPEVLIAAGNRRNIADRLPERRTLRKS